jgi:cytochrome c-type biogenesis protein CcmH/NrfG
MSQDIPPSEPNPLPANLESLEKQLRALPQPALPDALSKNLIDAIPSTIGGVTAAAGAAKLLILLAGIGIAAIITMAVVFTWLHGNSNLPPGPNSGTVRASPATEPSTATSKAVQSFENAVQFDPFNAAAWFNLAKAYAEVHRGNDAVSAAEKAIDIAKSRNNAALATAVEAWLKTYRTTLPAQSNH